MHAWIAGDGIISVIFFIPRPYDAWIGEIYVHISVMLGIILRKYEPCCWKFKYKTCQFLCPKEHVAVFMSKRARVLFYMTSTGTLYHITRKLHYFTCYNLTTAAQTSLLTYFEGWYIHQCVVHGIRWSDHWTLNESALPLHVVCVASLNVLTMQ